MSNNNKDANKDAKQDANKDAKQDPKQEFKELVIKLQEVFPNRKYDTQKFSTRKLMSFRKTAEELDTRNINKIKAKSFRNSKLDEFIQRTTTTELHEVKLKEQRSA